VGALDQLLLFKLAEQFGDLRTGCAEMLDKIAGSKVAAPADESQ
jgi:hypothetical protein